MATVSVEQIADRCEAEFARLRAARPALDTRISRAENILVTHLSCKRQRMIRARVRSGELIGYLVEGSGGAVYKVDPASWQCSCPDAHRRGKGCKHAILCWALWRAYRPASFATPGYNGRRCAAEPKIVRHEPGEGLEHVGAVAPRVLEGAARAEVASGSYEERTCSRCFEGLAYDGQCGEWVACEACSGTGRAVVFVYGTRNRRLRECAGCGGRYSGRDLFEVGDDNLTFFEGDELCEGCAADHGVL